MGNAPILNNSDAVSPREAEPSPVNGILGRIPGDLIAAGSNQLPQACDTEQPERQAVLNVPGEGRVRITYRLASHRHYRSQLWSWRAMRADRVQGDGVNAS